MYVGYLIIDNKTDKMSKLFSVGLQDFLHGLFIAVIGAVLAVVTSTLQAGTLTFDYKAIGTTAAIAALSYVSKKFLSNSEGQILTSEPSK
jgi:uncharacterized membrane protein YvlD (DUF360 family)